MNDERVHCFLNPEDERVLPAKRATLFRSKDERCLDELPHLSSADFGRRVAEL
jgi:hypothetical protein